MPNPDECPTFGDKFMKAIKTVFSYFCLKSYYDESPARFSKKFFNDCILST